MNLAIETRGLRRGFGDLVAVAGIDLTVEQGEIFALLGPNGAGKTTTMKMLSTLLRPSEGRASVNGFDVVRGRDAVRASIGLVFQEFTLDDYLTARRNLHYHCLLYHVPREDRAERVDAALQMLGLYERRDDEVRSFSGGMKRRLEIARALLHEPAVLFLDEPTVGLDPQTRRAVWSHLHDLREQTGMTLFFSTHYMGEAEDADRVSIVDHGRVIAAGRPDGIRDRLGAETLEDAFVELTGSEIRAEEASGRERLAASRRARGRARV
jgi:ABC-2 type transport system ATP-binding protein